jgi:2-dehydropantoate 2-reductase
MTDTAKPSIMIIGAGAVGGTIAAALGDAGQRPSFGGGRAFRKLSRSLQGSVSHYAFPFLDSPDEGYPADWVFLCTKSYQTAAASTWFERCVGSHTRMAVLQNGVDHIERLSPYVAPEHILPVVVQMACERTGLGAVKQTQPGRLFVPDNALGVAFARLFDGIAALEVVTESEFVSALWRKLTINATTGAICALTLSPNAVFGLPTIRDLAIEMMEEVMRVGTAEGAQFPEDFVHDTLARLAGPVGEHWTSMAADRRDGQPMEWEVRNAVVGRLGRKHAIPTPLNDALTALLSAVGSPDGK